MSAQEGNRIGDLDLDVEISGNVRESYCYEVLERKVVKKGTIGKGKRGKWNRGLLFRNNELPRV